MSSNPFSELLTSQKHVLSNKRYLAFFFFSCVVFAWLFIFLTSIPGQRFESWLYSTQDSTKLFVFLSSILIGLIFTTQLYVLRNYGFDLHGAKTGGSSIGAFLTGVIATACCSPFVAGALGLLGFAGFSFFITEHQLEFSIIALAILVISLYYSSKIVFCEECQVKMGVGAKRA